MCVCVCVYYTLSAMVIDIGNGDGELSSNLGRGCSHFTCHLYTWEKV